MASYAVAEAKHATFSTTVADLVTFTYPWQVVRIVNKDTTNTVYFAVNTTTAITAAAVDTHIVRPGEAVVFASKNPVKQVYLVGSGGDYSVEGFPGFGSSASSSGGTVAGSLTVDSEFPAAAALGDTTSNPTTTTVGAFALVWNGATWDRLPGTAAGGVKTKELRAATPTSATVAASASNVTVLASNANRLGATVFNDSSSIVYLKLGATATSSSYTVQMSALSYYEVPFGYTGIIDGIWVTATGNARTTELVV